MEQSGSGARALKKNTITDAELILYREAVEKNGNDWRKILGFFVKHKDVLSESMRKKYVTACNNINDKDAVKSIRNRLSNIGRKVRDKPEIREREERNAQSMSNMNAENIIVNMKKVRQNEKEDPLNNQVTSSDSEEDCRPGTSYDVDEVFGQSSSETEDDADHSDDERQVTTKKAKNKNKKGKGKKKAKRLKKGKREKSLTKKAEDLMAVGLKAAKLHMKFLKQSAQAQGLDMSSSSESS